MTPAESWTAVLCIMLAAGGVAGLVAWLWWTFVVERREQALRDASDKWRAKPDSLFLSQQGITPHCHRAGSLNEKGGTR